MAQFPSTTSASGVWTLKKQKRAQQGGNWPLFIVQDPYFDYTTLLLHGDGTNGAQNNTFLDSSTNNFTITRNGNTTQGSFSPYGTLWSNYTPGSAYLSCTDSTGLGSNDFTLEFWVFMSASGGNLGVFSVGATSGEDYAGITLHPSLGLYVSTTGSSWTYSQLATGGFDLSVWQHFAIVRNGSSLLIFKNGALQSTTSISGSIANKSGTIIIGKKSDELVTGVFNISNFRMVKGTALYTSNFTPSTAPLTAISGTSLLTCQSNRFKDNSSNNFTLTPSGNVAVSRFSPFAPTAAYSAATIGGSGYFDGSGDYLSSTSTSIGNFGTGDFTVEFWVYPNAVGGNLIDFRGTGGSGTSFRVFFYLATTRLDVGMSADEQILAAAGDALALGTWNHVAVTRSGSTVRLFANGVQIGTTTNTSSLTDSGLIVASYKGTTAYANGYLTNIRVVKGTALYTATFTPPTAPLTAVSGTSLLLNFTNAGIYDNAMMNNLETVGNAQVSTTQKKFGTGSIYFDGTGDYANVSQALPLFDYNTGNFTIEFWVYPLAGPVNSYNPTFYTNHGDGDWNATGKGVRIHHQNALIGSSQITFSTAVSNNVWSHIALVRNGNTITAYLNGASVGSVSYTGSVGDATDRPALATSDRITTGGREFLNGYIDDLRITKGIARYTANFTPPTAPFPDQ